MKCAILTGPDLSSSAGFITMTSLDANRGIDRADFQREKIGSKPQDLTERLAIPRSSDERVELPPPKRNVREIRPDGQNHNGCAIAELSIATVRPIPS